MKSRRKKIKKDRISYSLECSFLENGDINRAFLKIIVFLLITGLNWTGLLAIGGTLAYFNDIESSSENSYQAGTLDFSLQAPGDFSLNLIASSVAVRNINITNQGNLLFQYTIEGTDFSGSLCNYLNVEAKLNEDIKYSESLNGFSLSPPVLFSHPDNWQFEITFSGDPFEHKGEWCLFDFVFKGWQDNMSDYESSGFKDEESVFTRVTLKQGETIVLNEILPKPIGGSCFLNGILGEWVEIYNNSNIETDLYGWYIEDAESNRITIDNANTMSGSTMIGPKGSGFEWLVVLLNSDNGCMLDDDGDAVFLYHSANSLVDSYSYHGEQPENKSHARYPDGTGPWYDPIPTPGGPNILELIEEIIFEEIIFEEIAPILETVSPLEETIVIIDEEESVVEEHVLGTETIIVDELFVAAPLNPIQIEEEPIVEEEPVIEDPQPEPLKELEPELDNNDEEDV